MAAKRALQTLHERPWGTTTADMMVTRRYSTAGGWEPAALVPYGKVPLDPVASCLHYGGSVFEGLKAFRTLPTRRGGSTSPASPEGESSIVVFRPELNAARLNASAVRQALPTLPVEDFVSDVKLCANALKEWVPEERGSSLYIRVVLLATQPALGVRRSNEALLMVIGLPVPPYYTSPMRLLAETEYVRAWPGGAGCAKTAGNYAISVMPQERAAAKGMTLLWLDGSPRQVITECGVANFFSLWRSPRPGGKVTLVTPSLASGLILPGITRRSIIDLVSAEFSDKVSVEERDMGIDEVLAGIAAGTVIDAFGTGTAALVTPIQSVAKGEEEGKECVVRRSPVDGDAFFSTVLRERLLDIQHSLHPWNVVVCSEHCSPRGVASLHDGR
jgi:branched-chain amino acid aminotransferase